MLFDQKWIDDHPEQPEGYLVFPSSKVSAFLSHILADCTASSSKDPHGAVKSARKALRHLRACQAGIPDDEAKFPSQPYIVSRGDCLPNLYATLLLPIPYSDFYSQRRYLIATGDRNTRNVTIGTGAVLLGSPSAVLYSTPLL